MMKPIEQKTRQELIAEMQLILRAHMEEVMLLRHDLEVHREELLAQHIELQQAHALLETSRDAYAELFDFAPIAYLSLDPNGVIQDINLTGCAFLERERSRLVGLPLYSFITDADKTQFLDHMRRCRLGESRVESELAVRTRAGKEVTCLVTSRPDARPATTFRTVLMDITDRKRAAEMLRDMNVTLEQRVADRTLDLQAANETLKIEIAHRKVAEQALHEANQRKDDFLAMLGHELRNPLAPLRNAADILDISIAGNPALEEIVEILKRQTSHMTRLVDDLLDVARITRGKIVLQRETIDLRAIVVETVHDLQNSDAAHQLHFATNLPQQPVWVKGDFTRLTQVVNNLLQNSIKFTEPGGRISIDLHGNDVTNCCQLIVVDSGRGIEPEMLNRIFDTFTQIGASIDRNQGGLGLGLAVVRGLVELHGGKVHAFSEGLGKGARFSIEFPLAAPPPHAATTADHVAPNGKHSILLVDDSHDSLRMLKSLLEKLGQKVHTAVDAETGLELARSIRPEAIISDIGLPRMDGYGLARSVRDDQALSSVYLVALTGYGRPQDLRNAMDAGFDKHITKPVGLDELEEIVAGLGKVPPILRQKAPPIPTTDGAGGVSGT